MEYEITKMVTNLLAVEPAEIVKKLGPSGLEKYKEEQAALRSAVNAKATEAGREPVFTNEVCDFANFHICVRDDGKGFTLQKRETPFMVPEYDNDGVNRSAAALSHTVADHLGLNARRGKYNDASSRLIGYGTEALEVKEIQPDGSGNGFYG